MKIAISGASGLVGRRLQETMPQHDWTPLVRQRDRAGIYWNAESGEIDAAGLEGFDAVIHLAGEPIAEGRWTAAKKRRLMDSRAKGTALLAETLAGLTHKPKVLISASAVGYYGNTEDLITREDDKPGTGFMPEICIAWEAATSAAEAAGIRVCHTRIGIILDPAGGALKKMLPPFRLGLGGVVGNGEQYLSWISNTDIARAIGFLLETENCSGPYNLTGPAPVNNREFTKVLGKVLKRPTFFPLPAFVVRILLGEMGTTLLLQGMRVEPARLLEAGFAFSHTTLEEALRAELAG